MTDAQNSSPGDPYSADYDGATEQQKSRRLQAAGAVLLALILAAVLGLRSDPTSAGQTASGSAEAAEMPEESVDPEPVNSQGAQSTQGEEQPNTSQNPEEGSELAGGNLLEGDAEPDPETVQGTEEESDPETEIEVEVQANPETERDEDTFLAPMPIPIPVVTGSGTPIAPTEEDTEPGEDDPTHIGLPIPLPIPVPLPIPLPVPGVPGLPSLPIGTGGVLPVILPLPGGDDDEETPQPIIPIVPIINTTPDGEYWVQLGAFSTSDAGCIVWEDMAAVSPALFDDALKSVLPARSSSGNTVYRLRAGAFDTREEAVIFCDELKATGATCFVVKD